MGSIEVAITTSGPTALALESSAVDTRSILYVQDDVFAAFTHQITKPTLAVLRSAANEPRAVAQIRHVRELPTHDLGAALAAISGDDHASAAVPSFGLSAALGEAATTLRLEQLDNNLVPATLRLHLTMNMEPSAYMRKILQAMEQLAPKLLMGTLVWPGRRIPLRWRNDLDIAVVASIDADDKSSFASCVTAATDVTISNGPSPSPSSCGRPIPASAAVDVARELACHASVVHDTINFLAERFQDGTTGSRGVGALLFGVPGVGKSHFLRLLAGSIPNVRFHFVSSPDMFQTNAGASEQKILDIFYEASRAPWTVVVLEDVDAIAARSETALDKSVLATLLAVLRTLPRHVAVLATTNRKDVLDPALTTNGRLDLCLSMAPPTLPERHAILSTMCRYIDVQNDMLERMAARTSGFVGADLLSLVREAAMASVVNGAPGRLEGPHIDAGLRVVRPSVLQGQKAATSLLLPMFGVAEVLQTLDVAVVGPLRDSSAYRRMGIPPPRGVLLTGPSGSGKSHALAYVAATVGAHATVVPVMCTDLVTKVVGGTEQALSALFATARLAAPCALLFDQIESLAPVRGFDTSSEQTFDRVLSMLLLEMDGVGSSSSASAMRKMTHEAFLRQHVVLVATTTHASQLDPAILRPGRFDLEIGLAFPDATARAEVIAHLLAQTPVAIHDRFATTDAFTQWLVAASDGASVGQLNAVFQEAALACLRSDIHATKVALSFLEDALQQEIGKARPVDVLETDASEASDEDES